jgi:hypothetical protein
MATSKVPGAQLGQLEQFFTGFCGTLTTPPTLHGSVKLVRLKNSTPCRSIAAPTLTCGEPGKNCIPSIFCTNSSRLIGGKLITRSPHGFVKSGLLKT